ncbi:TraR/DksA C4-type zinc finger protein [Viridibacillus sp. YIM B01967]|uniref:TraR/DksA C4-type zinc finger protein n=1 Tax=Viridibacillus soli TaxID=2798301 RepID=A0ABS1H9M3_9BACL|nr:TraR/DksA C4-type zinc finger protein [Viridibacillus soli]MBK3496118.1 TraR/DksA C4-type zinc finger protein [Viridibacillus soli]
MTNQNFQSLKNQMVKELFVLQERKYTHELPESTELSNYDNHPADKATDLTDQVTEMAIEDHNDVEMEKLQAALHAIDDGTYGKCSECGEDIPFGRLEVMPTALTCVEHAPDDKLPTDRPVEEEVLNASTAQPVNDTRAIVDYEDSFLEVESFGSSDSPGDQIE